MPGTPKNPARWRGYNHWMSGPLNRSYSRAVASTARITFASAHTPRQIWRRIESQSIGKVLHVGEPWRSMLFRPKTCDYWGMSSHTSTPHSAPIKRLCRKSRPIKAAFLCARVGRGGTARRGAVTGHSSIVSAVMPIACAKRSRVSSLAQVRGLSRLERTGIHLKPRRTDNCQRAPSSVRCTRNSRAT